MKEAGIETPERPAAGNEPSAGIFDKTWELELLISGGVVFALLQFPPLLERASLRLEPSLAGWWKDAFMLSLLYLEGILYTLIGAFVLHLASRAYWIGLIGLDKVFPEGIRWEALKSGPVAQRTQRELTSEIRPLIVRIDLFCSAIFSFAFLVVLSCLASILMIGFCVLVAWGLSWWLGEQRISEIFLLIVLGVSLVMVLPGLLDKLLAGRLKAGGPMERALAGAFRVLHGFQLGTLLGSITLVLSSNSRRRFFAAVTAVVFAMILFFGLSQSQRRRLWSNDSPATDREILPFYYQDQWPEERTSRLAPSIPSDVIEGPYVKLFIPYLPDRHDPAFAKQCPSPRDKLACAARLHRVAVDGRAVPELTFHFYTHPKLGVRGFLAYIPTAGLASGSHLLRIEPLPVQKKLLRRRDPQPYFIRFWT